jgi:FkbM family methyltransferase
MKPVILYGIKENKRDVTGICLSKLTLNNIITIPAGDHARSRYFTDHLKGTEKKLFVILNGKEIEYDQTQIVEIDINESTVNVKIDEVSDKLDIIHNKLSIKHGFLFDELPEQKMVVRYLTGGEKVLEIGSNIGRNSLVIASIVNNETFVTLESDINIAKQLEENRDINNFNFQIEVSALSKRKLIQKGCMTKPSDVLENGYNWVNTISFDELKLKYNIEFDTLILDCEGAFYYILMDMSDILDNINLIIMENDYHEMLHKKFVDSELKRHNFVNIYKEGDGWGCCRDNFYEVWKKIS